MIAQSDNPVHPFDNIASKFNDKKDQPESIQIEAKERAALLQNLGNEPAPSINVEAIKCPAMILSAQLRIMWQNAPMISLVWHQDEPEKNGNNLDIFDHLFTSSFQERIENWRQWVAFFLQQALALMPAKELESLIALKNDKQSEMLQAMLADFQNISPQNLFSGHLNQKMAEDRVTAFQVIGIELDVGRLLLFEPTAKKNNGLLIQTNNAAPAIPAYMQQLQQQAIKMPFCVLAAQLNNSDTLSTEMLAGEWARLLNRLWEMTRAVIEQYGGIFSPNQSVGFIGFFASSADIAQNPIRVIQCAFELKGLMGDLGREWKIQKGWLHDMELNIGIHIGNEYVASFPSTLGDSIIALGNTLPMATYLAAIAQEGQIWTSKTLIDRLSNRDLESLRFGIYRNDHNRQICIPRCFSKIRDLSETNTYPYLPGDQLAEQAVTQVFDFQGQ